VSTLGNDNELGNHNDCCRSCEMRLEVDVITIFLSIAESYKSTNRTIEEVFFFSRPFVGEFAEIFIKYAQKGYFKQSTTSMSSFKQ